MNNFRTNFLEALVTREDISPSRSVCKNLFGTVVHDELREEVRQQNIGKLKEKKLKYNFDFEKDEPLAGRYIWQKVSNFDRTENRKKLLPEDGGTCKKTNRENSVKTNKPKNRSLTDEKEHKITDYFRSTKRKYEETRTEKDMTESVDANKTEHTATRRDMAEVCTTCLNRCHCA